MFCPACLFKEIVEQEIDVCLFWCIIKTFKFCQNYVLFVLPVSYKSVELPMLAQVIGLVNTLNYYKVQMTVLCSRHLVLMRGLI